MNVCSNRLFKHEVKVLKQNVVLSHSDISAPIQYDRLKANCSSLKLDEKPPTYGVHHAVGRRGKEVEEMLLLLLSKIMHMLKKKTK